ncbi:MAG: hypothetical protein UT20_C0006G0010 [Candidatus Levybacteria bacterium GW2011_GWA1_39_11]|nr:MAG: hypothetical protein UT20_C0006G0010 [Candidatus Levybacteria bacterium GW2011_GWA1_39_11]
MVEQSELKLQEIIRLLGDPKTVSKEMAAFRREARGYDPMPDKTLILGMTKK